MGINNAEIRNGVVDTDSGEKTCVELKQEELIGQILSEVKKNLKEYKSTDEVNYGCCPECGYKLVPALYEGLEDEMLHMRDYGKWRSYVSHYPKTGDHLLLRCDNCGHEEHAYRWTK